MVSLIERLSAARAEGQSRGLSPAGFVMMVQRRQSGGGDSETGRRDRRLCRGISLESVCIYYTGKNLVQLRG